MIGTKKVFTAMDTFEVAMKVSTFAVPMTFAFNAMTFVVQKLFENHAFP